MLCPPTTPRLFAAAVFISPTAFIYSITSRVKPVAASFSFSNSSAIFLNCATERATDSALPGKASSVGIKLVA